jgi:hypothetical protein
MNGYNPFWILTALVLLGLLAGFLTGQATVVQ